jgi:hypothetical protein
MKLLKAAKTTPAAWVAKVPVRAWVAKVPRWGWAGLVIILILLLILLGYSDSASGWTGFREEIRYRSEYLEDKRAKTLWDWIGLLIVPVVLAIGGYWLTQHRECLSREVERNRLREEALHNYLDRMAELMLEKGLQTSGPEDVVQNIARARTSAVLRGLDGVRKGILLRFLRESELIINEKAVVGLYGMDLRRANLVKANFRRSDLRGTDLRGANLFKADLFKADLAKADLTGANLVKADLTGVNLTGTNLTRADLTGANLSESYGLAPYQLRSAMGDAKTKLPARLTRPESWSKPAAM